MVRYLALINFTDEGIRKVEQSASRAAKFRSAVESAGGKVLSQYWAIGEIDGAVTFEAPNETLAAQLLLRLGRDGHVRSRSVRVFDEAEFAKIAAGG